MDIPPLEPSSPLSLLYRLLSLLSSIAVYLDATIHKIGRIKDNELEDHRSNFPAGLWALGTLLLVIVVLPTYSLSRPALIDRANRYPVHISWIQRTIVIFTLLMFVLVTTAFSLMNEGKDNPLAASKLQPVELVDAATRGDAEAECLLGLSFFYGYNQQPKNLNLAIL
jgi:hypothetical protein